MENTKEVKDFDNDELKFKLSMVKWIAIIQSIAFPLGMLALYLYEGNDADLMKIRDISIFLLLINLAQWVFYFFVRSKKNKHTMRGKLKA